MTAKQKFKKRYSEFRKRLRSINSKEEHGVFCRANMFLFNMRFDGGRPDKPVSLKIWLYINYQL